MSQSWWVGLLAAVALGAAGLLLPLLDRRGPRGAPVLAGVALAFAAPWAIPAELRPLRLVVGIVALAAAGKLLDALLDGGRWPPAREWLTWVTNPFGLVRKRLQDEPLLAPRAALRRVALDLLQVAAGVGLCAVLFLQAPPLPFPLEHAARVVAVFVVIEGVSRALTAAARGLGVHAREVLVRPWVAATPAEFWRRYNRVVGQLLERCWRAWGGRRAPVRATLLVFLFSGLFHEYLFLSVVGAVQGFQLAFFLLQGVGVVLTARLRPRGAARALGIGLTLGFNLASGVLFVASLHEVFPGLWTRWPLPWGPV